MVGEVRQRTTCLPERVLGIRSRAASGESTPSRGWPPWLTGGMGITRSLPRPNLPETRGSLALTAASGGPDGPRASGPRPPGRGRVWLGLTLLAAGWGPVHLA